MIIRKLNHDMVKAKPYEVWNSFVDILAREKYENLDDVQRIAHLCFWYDSEVQNGGHLQYFENRGIELLDETLAALDSLGAACQRTIHAKATQFFLDRPQNEIRIVKDYVATALKGEFDDFDSRYYKCVPSIVKLLEDYLKMHRDHFVEIV
jgi:hypothetical protein